MTGEESVFVKIDDPAQFRRSLLESSRDMVHSLQRYEHIKDLRVKKVEAVSELRNIMKDIGSLMNKLRSNMPTIDIKSAPTQRKKEIKLQPAKKEKKETSKEPEKNKDNTSKELVNLEKELNDIEKKLNSLS